MWIYSPTYVFLSLGWKGFIGLMSDGTITAPSDFLTGLIGVDFFKNLLITWTCYTMYSSCTCAATQKNIAYGMMMMGFGSAYSCVAYPMAGGFFGIPPPAAFYIGTTMSCYIFAFATDGVGDTKGKKK